MLPLCAPQELIDCSPPGDAACLGLTPGDVVVDIGLHTGSHFTGCSREQMAGVGIIAFEPQPKFCKEAKMKARHWTQRLGLAFFHVHCKAVSDRKGSALMFTAPNAEASASLTGSVAAPFGGAAIPLNISLVTLDDVLAGPRYGSKIKRRVRVVKTDTQGHEVSVLRGARGLLKAGGVSKLMVELDPRLLREGGSSAEQLLAMTHTAGFTCGYLRRQFECAEIEGSHGRKCWNDLYCTRSRSDFCERHWLAPFRTNAVWPLVPRHCVRFDGAAFSQP